VLLSWHRLLDTSLPMRFPRGALPSGGKLIFVNRGKNAVVVRLGRKPISEGVNIVAAHVDAPRIDVKQNPLFESTGLGLFQTHYYGGIRSISG